MGSKIKKCVNPKCKHEYQDSKYGAGMRVMNEGKKAAKDSPPPLSCTVCGTKQ